MRVGYTILTAAAESGLMKIADFSTINQHTTPSSMENMSIIINSPDRQDLHFHCNVGVKYTNKIVYLAGYSNPVWYNTKRIDYVP